jgi:hypothetical protein
VARGVWAGGARPLRGWVSPARHGRGKAWGL